MKSLLETRSLAYNISKFSIHTSAIIFRLSLNFFRERFLSKSRQIQISRRALKGTEAAFVGRPRLCRGITI